MKKWMEFSLNGADYNDLNSYLEESHCGDSTYGVLLVANTTPNFEPGKLGNALHITDSYLSFRKKTSDGYYSSYYCGTMPLNFSWASWIYIDSSNTGHGYEIFNAYSTKPLQPTVWLAEGGKNNLSLGVKFGTLNSSESQTSGLTSPENTIEYGKWYHVAFTYNDVTKKLSLYIDGKEVDSYVHDKYKYNSFRPEEIHFEMGNNNIGNSYTKKFSNVIFSNECWAPQEVAMLAEPMLAHYPLKYNHYVTRCPNGEWESFSYFTDCKFRGDKKHINRGYESSSYEIVDMVNEGLTGRYLGSAKVLDTYDFESVYSDFFANLDHQERTVSFWFNIEIDYPEKDWGTIMSLWSSDDIDFQIRQDGWYLEFHWSWNDGRNVENYKVWCPSNEARRFNKKTLAAIETFRLLTLTYDGETIKVYIDGILEESFPFSHPLDGYLSIGGHDFGSHNYTYASQLRFNDVRIYAKALSKEEIEELYYRGIEIDTKENVIIAGEFVETSYSAFHPKGVIFCKEIQEDASITCPTLTTEGILKVIKIIER